MACGCRKSLSWKCDEVGGACSDIWLFTREITKLCVSELTNLSTCVVYIFMHLCVCCCCCFFVLYVYIYINSN